jgi:hypothetical protein
MRLLENIDKIRLWQAKHPVVAAAAVFWYTVYDNRRVPLPLTPSYKRISPPDMTRN